MDTGLAARTTPQMLPQPPLPPAPPPGALCPPGALPPPQVLDLHLVLHEDLPVCLHPVVSITLGKVEGGQVNHGSRSLGG